jgi:hypothetical protein
MGDDSPTPADDAALLGAMERVRARFGGKKTRAADRDVIAEALRIHGNVRKLRAEDEARLSVDFEEPIKAGYWPGLGSMLNTYCRWCLAEGLGWRALHGDDDAARRAFAAARTVLPYYRRMQMLGASAPMTWKKRFTKEEHRRTFGGARDFERAPLCLVLADDRPVANVVAELVADPRLTLKAEDDHFDVFVRHFAAVLRGEGESVSWADYEKAHGMSKLMINPYRKPLVALAHGDLRAVDAAVPAFEEAYAALGRMRDPTHSDYGCSPLGQATSFNVYGTALLRLSVWCGATVHADTHAHPGAFIQSAA